MKITQEQKVLLFFAQDDKQEWKNCKQVTWSGIFYA